MRRTATATAASAAPPSPTSDLARAARRLIITCERLIPNDDIRQDPSRTIIPFYCVDAVCEVPFGSYPGNMPYEYFSDEQHLREWLAAETDLEHYQEFIERYIFGVKDFAEYLELLRRPAPLAAAAAGGVFVAPRAVRAFPACGLAVAQLPAANPQAGRTLRERWREPL